MIRIATVIALLGLVACGVDGEPLQPSADLNVAVGSDGVYTGGTIGLTRGPISVGVGVF
ncbi:hypothetical protein [Tateyamaria pelophila]|uniref:hypothetical protein n=1 Tax=Tateyamaria pelophila TaxID=328415 RepID=UPI001CBB3231|nr:hypothetical protein [Tateyamaria pelophila]